MKGFLVVTLLLVSSCSTKDVLNMARGCAEGAATSAASDYCANSHKHENKMIRNLSNANLKSCSESVEELKQWISEREFRKRRRYYENESN